MRNLKLVMESSRVTVYYILSIDSKRVHVFKMNSSSSDEKSSNLISKEGLSHFLMVLFGPCCYGKSTPGSSICCDNVKSVSLKSFNAFDYSDGLNYNLHRHFYISDYNTA